MSLHQVQLDFQQNQIKTKSHFIESSTARLKCYKFRLDQKSASQPNSVNIVPEIIISKAWLFGPATDLKTISIIYPCTRYRCLIPCPCLLCAHRKHPFCRAPTSEGCNCEECKHNFVNHTKFHAVFHYGCKFCYQITQRIPNFNFSSLDFAKKKYPGLCSTSRRDSDHRCPFPPYFVSPAHKLSLEFFQMWGEKRKKWLNDTEDIGDMWCRHCNLLFWSFEDLRNHMQSHLSTKIFGHYWRNGGKRHHDDTKCFQCSKSFSTVWELQRHVDELHYEDSHECDTCGVTYSRKENLERHMKLKHSYPEKAKLACEDCGKKFTRSDTLKRHAMIAHSGSVMQKFKCDQCGKSFNREAHLTRHHENIFHKDGAGKNKCDPCGKLFCSDHMLREHIKLNHCESEEKFKCDSCSENFDTIIGLNAHKSSSHMPDEFHCLMCSESFVKKSNLVQHRKMNHEIKEFKVFECHLCLTMFTSRFALERHQKEVFIEGSPIYDCKKCNDYFCTSRQMKNHISSKHVSFLCEFCDKKFSKKSNLEFHLKRKLQNPAVCNLCGKSMCNSLLLGTHMKKEHASQEEVQN